MNLPDATRALLATLNPKAFRTEAEQQAVINAERALAEHDALTPQLPTHSDDDIVGPDGPTVADQRQAFVEAMTWGRT